MRAPDFIINLLTRFTPIAPEELGNLKHALGGKYHEVLTSYLEKDSMNKKAFRKMAELEKELEKHDVHTEEYQKVNGEIEELKFEIEKPTVIEKIINWLESPFVRVGLMVMFSVCSYFIMKKLTKKAEPEIEEDESEGNYPQNGYYPPHQFYPPYPPYNPAQAYRQQHR